MTLWIVAALIAAALAPVAVVWTRLSRRRVQAVVTVHTIPYDEWERQALDLVAERDNAKADHINAAMRRVEHAWTHLTAEEAADCRLCSPSGLPQCIEEQQQ